MRRLEQAIKQLRRKGSYRDSIDKMRKFEEASEFAVGEVETELKEKISNLEKKLSEYRKSSTEERKELEQKIERLKTTIETLSKKKKKDVKTSKKRRRENRTHPIFYDCLDFPSETFCVLKEKEERKYSEYRTRRLILEVWDGLRTY